MPSSLTQCIILLSVAPLHALTLGRSLLGKRALVMAGETQSQWEHALPLEPGRDPHRISLTFRSIVPGWEEGREPPHVA